MHWQLQVYYQVHPKQCHQMQLKRICHCSIYTLLGLTRCTKKFTVTSFYDWPNFASICTLQSIFKSILKCIPYTLIYNLSYIWGSYLWLSIVVPSMLFSVPSSLLLHQRMYHLWCWNFITYWVKFKYILKLYKFPIS